MLRRTHRQAGLPVREHTDPQSHPWCLQFKIEPFKHPLKLDPNYAGVCPSGSKEQADVVAAASGSWSRAAAFDSPNLHLPRIAHAPFATVCSCVKARMHTY